MENVNRTSKVLINASFPTGVIKLPPIPCTTLATTKNDKLGESEQSNEPKLNKINEKINTFLVPNLSAKKPLAGINSANVST